MAIPSGLNPNASDALFNPATGQLTEIGRILIRTLTAAVGTLAPTGARYWLSSGADATGLSAEQNLGALASGYLKLAVAIGIATPSTVSTIPQADVTGLAASLALLAPLASPAQTGTPTVPTAAPGTNTTQTASTAFVTSAVAGGAAVKRASAYNSAVQSINSGAWTVLTLDSEDWDTDTFHSTSVNTSRLTVPTGGDGAFIVRAKTRFAANAAGTFRGISVYKNGTAFRYLAQAVNAPGNDSDVQIDVQLPLVATDYVEAAGYQDTGGALNLGGATRALSTELQLMRIGA